METGGGGRRKQKEREEKQLSPFNSYSIYVYRYNTENLTYQCTFYISGYVTNQRESPKETHCINVYHFDIQVLYFRSYSQGIYRTFRYLRVGLETAENMGIWHVPSGGVKGRRVFLSYLLFSSMGRYS